MKKQEKKNIGSLYTSVKKAEFEKEEKIEKAQMEYRKKLCSINSTIADYKIPKEFQEQLEMVSSKKGNQIYEMVYADLKEENDALRQKYKNPKLQTGRFTFIRYDQGWDINHTPKETCMEKNEKFLKEDLEKDIKLLGRIVRDPKNKKNRIDLNTD